MKSFFEHQDRARRNTTLLVVLMALGVIGIALGLYAVVLLGGTYVGAVHGGGLFQLKPLVWSLLGTAVIVAGASASRMLSLRSGGQIAEMLGGRLVSGNPRDVLERRLVNVVEEMAIASGVPVPQVFVLEDEVGINAFAAGFALDDAAIAVTRGCLEKLTRDELQGVIAHEFSHVLNGDMRLNIQLMGIVFGIMCIGLLGRLAVRASGNVRSSRRGSPAAALVLFGSAVWLIGLTGEFFGKLIKAAVGRQREYLADASAVQFTRNPAGIGGALMKIGGYAPGAQIATARAEEASHFFFGDIHARKLFSGGPFATHPPLAERIARIDPSFRGQFPAVAEGIAEPDEAPVSGFAARGPNAPTAHAAAWPSASQSIWPEQVVERIGAAEAADPEHGRQLLQALPPALRAAAESPFSAGALVYAMLLADQAAVAQRQYALIEAEAGAALLSETLRFTSAIAGLGRRDRLSLVELIAPALRALSRDQRAVFARTVQALIDADAAVSIFESVIGQVLSERMAEPHIVKARARVRHTSLRQVVSELQLLLSLLAHAGAGEPDAAARAFAAATARLPGLEFGLLGHSARLLSGLSGALVELRALAPQLRAQVVDACAHCILADRRVSEDEVTLLCAVCGALGCPLPPFAAGDPLPPPAHDQRGAPTVIS